MEYLRSTIPGFAGGNGSGACARGGVGWVDATATHLDAPIHERGRAWVELHRTHLQEVPVRKQHGEELNRRVTSWSSAARGAADDPAAALGAGAAHRSSLRVHRTDAVGQALCGAEKDRTASRQYGRDARTAWRRAHRSCAVDGSNKAARSRHQPWPRSAHRQLLVARQSARANKMHRFWCLQLLGWTFSLSRTADRPPSPPAHRVRSPEAIGTASQDDWPSYFATGLVPSRLYIKCPEQ